MTVHVETTAAGAITVVTLDRPDRRNALDHATLEELLAVFTAAQTRLSRVLVLTGASGHFCAGADLQGVEDPAFTELLTRVLEALRDLPFPTIAAVEGAALGGGTQLAVACDLRVAAETASFGIPAGKLGLMVTQWTVQRLAALVGSGPARAILLAAEVLSGAEAHRLGLVNRIGALPEALAWAEEIAKLAPLTLAGHKLMLAALETEIPESDTVTAAYGRAWHSEDLAEGIDAFRNRRRPEFRGR